MSRTDDALAGPKVTLFLGPGGVGKTTMAAAAGIAAAKRGERVIVLTIDPARRLANTLGLTRDGLGHQVTTVDGPWPGQLLATMLDPAEMFASIIIRHVESVERQQRIMVNPIFHNLQNSLSGTNEYMATERLYELWQMGNVDRVIVDTPPSKHAFDFLDSPERLTKFLDHQLYRIILRPQKGLLRTLNIAGQQVLRLLNGLVGSTLVTDVVDFFADLDGLDTGFSQRAHATNALLTSDLSQYILVTTPRSEPLREAEWITSSLIQRGRKLSMVVANRTTSVPTEVLNFHGKSDTAEVLKKLLNQVIETARLEAAELSKLAGPNGKGTPAWLSIPETAEPVHDLVGLERIADQLVQFNAVL